MKLFFDRSSGEQLAYEKESAVPLNICPTCYTKTIMGGDCTECETPLRRAYLDKGIVIPEPPYIRTVWERLLEA
jgi:hypothetical protein